MGLHDDRDQLDPNSVNRKYVVSLLRNGDLASFRAYQGPRFARIVAKDLLVRPLDFMWECLLAPDAIGDPDALVREAELYLKEAPRALLKAQYMRVVGAAMYRAGRFDEGIARIEESIRMREVKARSVIGSFWRWPTHARAGGPRR